MAPVFPHCCAVAGGSVDSFYFIKKIWVSVLEQLKFCVVYIYALEPSPVFKLVGKNRTFFICQLEIVPLVLLLLLLFYIKG